MSKDIPRRWLYCSFEPSDHETPILLFCLFFDFYWRRQIFSGILFCRSIRNETPRPKFGCRCLQPDGIQ